MTSEEIIKSVKECVVRAGSTFKQDKIVAYEQAIEDEDNPRAKWTLEAILENAHLAAKQESPLCDDTGIPHLILDIGPKVSVSGEMLEDIKTGVAEGLRALPGRPMGIMGDDIQRIDQSGELDTDPAGVMSSPILLRKTDDNVLRLHVLMFGGGPAIRAKTYRVFHKHNANVVFDEIVSWAKDAVAQLGCSPCTLGIGIGRSHFEASSMMLQALADGDYSRQSRYEKEITARVNESDIGPLGLHGKHSVLATFLKVGPQRASGVRIVCLRPCCCFEPRVASVDFLNRTSFERIGRING